MNIKRLRAGRGIFFAVAVSFLCLSLVQAADLIRPQPKKKITVPLVRISYKNDRMTDYLPINRTNQNPGIITGDTLDFQAVASAGLPTDASRYSWSGAITEQGKTVSVVYGNPGNFPLTLNIFDKNSNRNKFFTATTQSKFLGPEKETDICPSTDPATLANCGRGALDSSLAQSWAEGGDMAVSLGFARGPCTADDGKCNAAKHAYWNVLMVRDTGNAFAARIATAHERFSAGFFGIGGTSGIDAGSAHNSSAMDLNNNSSGRAIASGLTFASSLPSGDEPGKGAIADATNAGNLTKLDPLPNPDTGPLKSSSLLTPSNQ